MCKSYSCQKGKGRNAIDEELQDTFGIMANTAFTELYTDESPGLKVDPVVVLVLSVGFIISVVALHSMLNSSPLSIALSNRTTVIAKVTRKMSS